MKRRLNFPGTTAGTGIGPIGADTEVCWSLTFALKKKFFGPSRMFVGGRDEDSMTDGTHRKVERENTDVEPVFYHRLPYIVLEDLAHATAQQKPKGIVDFTGGELHLARYAIHNFVPAVIFVPTETAVVESKKELLNIIWKDMGTEGSDLHEPELTEILQMLNDENQNKGDGATNGKKKKTKAKAKSGKKRKPTEAGNTAATSKKAALKNLKADERENDDKEQEEDDEDADSDDDAEVDEEDEEEEDSADNAKGK
jgi:hypothetical protein